MIETVRVLVDGEWINLTYDTETDTFTGKLDFIKPSILLPDGYYNLQLEAINESGITTTATAEQFPVLKHEVIEIDPPQIELVSPTGKYVTTNTPILIWHIFDGEYGSGVDIRTLKVFINGQRLDVSAVSYSEIDGGFEVTAAVPDKLPDGYNSCGLEVTDRNGNKAEMANTLLIDTTPPEIVFVSDDHLIVDEPKVEFAGIVTDNISTNNTLQAIVNGESPIEIELSANGNFIFPVSVEIGENSVDIIAADEAGWKTKKTFRVIRLITDRTQSDIDYLLRLYSKPQALWNESERQWFTTAIIKGAYDYTDLNRVMSAMEYLRERLLTYGILVKLANVQLPNGRKYFVNTDIQLNPKQLNVYLDNVRMFAGSFPIGRLDLPKTLQNHNLTYAEANNIEKALVMVDALLPYFNFFYSDEVTAGEV